MSLSAKQQKRVRSLLNTSVDDCRNSIADETNVDLLIELHKQCIDQPGHKTRATIVMRRINQISREKK